MHFNTKFSLFEQNYNADKPDGGDADDGDDDDEGDAGILFHSIIKGMSLLFCTS